MKIPSIDTIFTSKALKSEISHLQNTVTDLELKLASDDKKIIINQINVKPVVRQGGDIGKWRAAIKQAEGNTQTRLNLYNLYKESLLDGHLAAIIEKRIEAITNTNIRFVLEDGSIEDNITTLASQTYFQSLLKEVVSTKFWGKTLIQLDFPLPNQQVNDGAVYLIPRAHVKPRFKIVVANPNDNQGIDYTSPEWNDILIECGEDEDLGLLLQACKYEIIKRGALSDWAEFAETFGIDPLIAKYNNPETRKDIEEALDARGAGGSLSVPSGVEIDPLAGISKTGSSQLFSKLNDAMNEGMSIVILGQTMTTTDSKSSGYAQGYIHSQVEGAKYRADRRYVERVLNNQLTPYLEKIGWKTQGGSWQFVDEDHTPLDQRIRVDVELAKIIPLDQDELYKAYGRNKPKVGDATGGGTPQSKEEKKPKEQRSFFD